jgi:PAS domain-containing protein
MPEELLEMKIGDIIVQEDGDVEFDLRKLVPYGDHEGAHSERQCIRKDGTRVWVSLNASLIKDHDASPLYFVVQVEDITAEKEAADKLRRYEANIRATINNTDMLIWGVDRNFDTIMFNNQFARHIQARYGQEVYLGANMFPPLGTAEMDIITEKWKALLARALAGERIKIEEQRFGLDYQYALNPIIEGSKVIGVSIFADDVTDRKRRERELNEANKKISELRLLALRSVMSPHFIFNVLNSIQYFIAKNDRFNAINYLSAFSKLVRNILTHSVTNKITLSDEIEMLENYVQLEMTRFENKFAFSLTIDPSIEADSVVIPSLLIQPYVENAILHGLNTKPADGKLWIRVREEEAGMLSFEIEDNGIGRAAAMELRRHNLLPHTSMGINITEERLKLINNGHRTAVEIEDLIESGKPAGTRVKILVSYLPE